MKEEIHVIQTTKPPWLIKTDAKLVDLEDRFRQNNLRFEGEKEHENDSWEDCKKINLRFIGKQTWKWTLQTFSSREHIEPERKARIDYDQ